MKTKPKYRFFYHYYKAKKSMSVHFRNSCFVVDNIECRAECETKWNPRQPQLVMRGYASKIEIKDYKNGLRKAIIYS
jgi:hypothetical protein